ncbi:MAG TPA: class I SAM-dependent methyltransferase [Thiobacillaceae bacterium]|nr:class I SAM-dependent methyltransferase [Thiobacillaceae bacterium]
MTFKDHFSTGSPDYAAFRPNYPPALFAWLAGLCRRRELAWDCATGNGQAALELAHHFKQVIATDASAQQIEAAKHLPGVEYRVAAAEASGLKTISVDLIAVAQAVHWFDLERFYAEARRVLHPGGVIALWGYGPPILPEPMDQALAHFYAHTIGPYWPPERTLVDDRYRSLAFPFDEVPAPSFAIEVSWNLPRLIAYLATWSAVKRYIAAIGTNPLTELEAELALHWSPQGSRRDGPDGGARRLEWPLFLRVGYRA